MGWIRCRYAWRLIKGLNVGKPNVVFKYLREYLKKSKDTKEEFFDDFQGTIYSLGDRGWVEYIVIGNIFWIRTMYWDTKSLKESNDVWEDIKNFAKMHKCTSLQFTTKRDGRLWERRFKEMKVVQWKIEAKL